VVDPISECDLLLGLRLCSLPSSFRPHGKVECSYVFALYHDTFTIFVDHCRYARCRRMARRHWRQPRNGHVDQQPENSLSLRRGAGEGRAGVDVARIPSAVQINRSTRFNSNSIQFLLTHTQCHTHTYSLLCGVVCVCVLCVRTVVQPPTI
jgi:hypothetical protein